MLTSLAPEIASLTVADSEVDFVDKAVALGLSPELRNKIADETKRRLPTAPFIDTEAFGRRLSDVFQRIVDRLRSQKTDSGKRHRLHDPTRRVPR